jgi:hypothetical protein
VRLANIDASQFRKEGSRGKKNPPPPKNLPVNSPEGFSIGRGLDGEIPCSPNAEQGVLAANEGGLEDQAQAASNPLLPKRGGGGFGSEKGRGRQANLRVDRRCTKIPCSRNQEQGILAAERSCGLRRHEVADEALGPERRYAQWLC